MHEHALFTLASGPGQDCRVYKFQSFNIVFVFLSPSSLSSSLCSRQRCFSSLHSWFIHNGLVLNPTKTEAICIGTSPRLQSLSHLTSIAVAGISVSLVDYVKLLGVTFDKHLNFYEHISNVCSSSYFHIRALRHIRPFLDSETSKTTACAIVGSRLDYVNSILTGISSRNIRASTCWPFPLEFPPSSSQIYRFLYCPAFKTSWLQSLLAQIPTPPQL